ncbi:hypothetical protein [Reichenbachiella agariperforans]|uniref:hypothetical protein n=1 Tax=Reichenbachiella agariperforans TaxID=156994 RepID=UPI001C0A1762|nr:hypothetical protein [Reichenbachiella agariperforans]MBU2914993.1 hypothetical protein [Reichenbachiella agariperforans]
MSISQITHRGKKIVLIDYSKCKNKQDMLQLGSEVPDYLIDLPEEHLLILFDYTNAHGSSEFMKQANESRERVLHHKTTKSAAIGITGIKKILLKGYNALSSNDGMQPFDTKEAALEYLLKKEDGD